MSKRIMIAGIVVVAALITGALGTAGQKESADQAALRMELSFTGNVSFLEPGKAYAFRFLPGVAESEWVTYKVLEKPHDGWVRVGLSDAGGAMLVPTWINLQTVAKIVHNPNQK